MPSSFHAFGWDRSWRKTPYAHFRKILSKHQGRRFFFPGFLRIVQAVTDLLQPKRPIQIRLDDFEIYLNGRDTVMTPEILVSGAHEPLETQLIKKNLKPGMTFIDLGANIGYFTLLAAKCVGPSGKVYAFEPEPVNREYLVKNIELNGLQNVQVVPKIVSNISGTARLYKDKGNLGAHTCAKENIATIAGDVLEVSSVTLDEFVEREKIQANFIKMDVQGAEGLILEKAQNTLARNPVKILFEFWPQGLRNLGTDPKVLLETLFETFTLREIDGTTLTPSQALQKAEAQYLNLFLEKKQKE